MHLHPTWGGWRSCTYYVHWSKLKEGHQLSVTDKLKDLLSHLASPACPVATNYVFGLLCGAGCNLHCTTWSSKMRTCAMTASVGIGRCSDEGCVVVVVVKSTVNNHDCGWKTGILKEKKYSTCEILSIYFALMWKVNPCTLSPFSVTLLPCGEHDALCGSCSRICFDPLPRKTSAIWKIISLLQRVLNECPCGPYNILWGKCGEHSAHSVLAIRWQKRHVHFISAAICHLSSRF